MNSTTLSLWGKGAVTLPKQWRDRYPTKHFLAEETPKGLLIRPIEYIEYYEDEKGNFGLHFPMGIPAGEFLKLMKKADAKIRREEKHKRAHRK